MFMFNNCSLRLIWVKRKEAINLLTLKKRISLDQTMESWHFEGFDGSLYIGTMATVCFENMIGGQRHQQLSAGLSEAAESGFTERKVSFAIYTWGDWGKRFLFKKLAGKTKIHRVGQQVGSSITVFRQNFFFFVKPQFLFLKTSSDCIEAHSHYQE